MGARDGLSGCGVSDPNRRDPEREREREQAQPCRQRPSRAASAGSLRHAGALAGKNLGPGRAVTEHERTCRAGPPVKGRRLSGAGVELYGGGVHGEQRERERERERGEREEREREREDTSWVLW